MNPLLNRSYLQTIYLTRTYRVRQKYSLHEKCTLKFSFFIFACVRLVFAAGSLRKWKKSVCLFSQYFWVLARNCKCNIIWRQNAYLRKLFLRRRIRCPRRRWRWDNPRRAHPECCHGATVKGHLRVFLRPSKRRWRLKKKINNKYPWMFIHPCEYLRHSGNRKFHIFAQDNFACFLNGEINGRV